MAVIILEKDQKRVLGFIFACNRSGYLPTVDEVRMWLDSPHPTPAPTRVSQMLEQLALVVTPLHIAPPEHALDHVRRLGWVDGNMGLHLSPLGLALFQDSERMDEFDDRAVVVLKSEDQLAYARLIGELAKVGASLLVDPYFRIDQLGVIVEATDISRVLISKQYKESRSVRAALRVGLNALDSSRKIEIRATADQSLHDRAIVTPTGKVFSLGTSLNSVGIVNTVYMELHDVAASAVRSAAESLWQAAEVVGPTPQTATSDGIRNTQVDPQ